MYDQEMFASTSFLDANQGFAQHSSMAHNENHEADVRRSRESSSSDNRSVSATLLIPVRFQGL